MSSGKLFAYNPTHISISGAQLIGDISIQTGTIPASDLSKLNWYFGPDEDIYSWLIAGPNSSDNAPQFWAPEYNTEVSFLDLMIRNFNQNFSTLTEATDWLSSNGYWYSSDISSSKFILEINIPTTQTVTLPTPGTNNYTIDWGDGSELQTVTTTNPTHTYSGGTYNLSMFGSCTSFNVNNGTFKSFINKVVAWGQMGFTTLNFYGCNNLTTLPSGSITGADSILNFTNTFRECDKLNLIPPELFVNTTKIASLNYTFYKCTSLSGISADLFKYNNKITNFNYTFAYTKLSAITSGLFDYNTGVTNFNYTFYFCDNLQLIPTDLFRYNVEVTDFTGVFERCQILQNLPNDLFRYNTKVLSFASLFAACFALSSIPIDLFKYNTKVTDFNWIFRGDNISTLPIDLFRYNTKVTNFSQSFGSTKLKLVQSDFFQYNTEVTNFSGTFMNCTTLTGISSGSFNNNLKVTDFSNLFYGCESLKEIPTDLFNYNTGVTIFQYMFYGCTSLKLNRNIFYPDGEQSTRFLNKSVNFSGCFYRTSFTGTQGEAPDLWNCSFGTGTPTKTTCFGGAGNSLTSISNYNDIPADWK